MVTRPKRVLPTVLAITIALVVCVFLTDMFLFDKIFKLESVGLSVTNSKYDQNFKHTNSFFEFISDYFNKKKISLIIMKLPRSGSSWFTEKLNDISQVYITKEILQHHHANFSFDSNQANLYVSRIENHLHQALKKPSKKFSARLLPDGRFIEDYVFHPEKYIYGIKYVGFTLNPEHIMAGVFNWSMICKSIDYPILIVYMRTNIVKMALSGYRGKLSHDICGSSNLRSDQIECNLPNEVDWNVIDFIHNVNYWQDRYIKYLQYIMNTKVLQVLPRKLVFYEDLQLNDNKPQELLDYLGKKIWRSDRLLASSEHSRWDSWVEKAMDVDYIKRVGKLYRNSVDRISESAFGGSWSKRSVEDLKTLLTQYDEIRRFLMSQKACDCILRQLESKSPYLSDMSCLAVKLTKTGCTIDQKLVTFLRAIKDSI